MVNQATYTYRPCSLEMKTDKPDVTLTCPGIECLGTGLAVYWTATDANKPCGYRLVHLASGCPLTLHAAPSLVQVGKWLQRVRTFTDWTQDAEILRKRLDLRDQVVAAYQEATKEKRTC